MISAGYAELYRGRYAEALQCFAQVRDPGITPNFFLQLVLANAGPAWFE